MYALSWPGNIFKGLILLHVRPLSSALLKLAIVAFKYAVLTYVIS